MTKSELKELIHECIEEINNEELVNEEYLNISKELESILESTGYTQEDLKDPNKALKICKTVSKDKNKSSKEKIEDILKIIAFIIIIIPAVLLAPIWIPLMYLIGNIKDKLSAKDLEKTIEKLKKQKAKLEKKLAQSEDEKEKEALKKAISELDKQIKSLEKELIKAKNEKRYFKEYMFIRGALKIEKDKFYPILDGYDIDIFCFATIYLQMSDKDIHNTIYEKSFDDYNKEDLLYDTEFVKWLEKNLGCDSKDMYINAAIDDTITIYNPKNKKLYHGDYAVKAGDFYTFSDLRNEGKKIFNDPDYNFKEAEASLDEVKNKRL